EQIPQIFDTVANIGLEEVKNILLEAFILVFWSNFILHIEVIFFLLEIPILNLYGLISKHDSINKSIVILKESQFRPIITNQYKDNAHLMHYILVEDFVGRITINKCLWYAKRSLSLGRSFHHY
ncbi:hypothetical protein ACJX0J_018278, partial [Zea mays]